MEKLSAVIAGTGKYLPERVVTSEYVEERLKLQERFGLPAGFIEKMTGIKERRYVQDGQVSSDLAYQAGLRALAQAHVPPQELDVVIFASASHDISEPATANILQDKLGAKHAQVFDVKNACNSFLNGLDIMDSFIKTGRCRVGLVATGEVLSGCVNWEINTLEELTLGFAGLTLGDGGGAAVVKAASPAEGKGIQKSCFVSEGSAWELATIKYGGTMFPRDLSQSYFVSHSAELSQLATERIPPVLATFLQEVGWNPQEIDLVVPHQVTRRVIREVSQLVEIPFERCMVTLTQYGNCAAASVPMALAEAMERGLMRPGSKVLLVGGAAGFSVGVIALVP